MVHRIRITILYWWEDIKNATKSTAKIFGVRVYLLLDLCYVVILILVSSLKAKGILLPTIIADLTDDLASELRVALVLLFPIVVITILQTLYIPAKTDEDQKKLIDYFQNRHKAPQIRVRPINKGNWVGIEIFNMEEDVRVDIATLIIKDIPQLDVLSSPLELMTERESYISYRLSPKSWTTFLLAKLSSDGTDAHIAGLYEQLSIGLGSYDIFTHLSGQIEFNEFRPVETIWKLKYDQAGSELKLEKQDELSAP